MDMNSWAVFLVLLVMCVFVGWPILRAQNFKAPWSAWLLLAGAFLGLILSGVAKTLEGGAISTILNLSGSGVILVASLISARAFGKLPPGPTNPSLGGEGPKSLEPAE